MIKVGFTGTQDGMTEAQRVVVWKQLEKLKEVHGQCDFHHGDCVGADEQADNIAYLIGYRIIVHPPKNPAKQAKTEHFTTSWPAKNYLDRNKDIVNESDVLIATPSTLHEVVRSGTWSTIRYARGKNKPIVNILPDGTLG